MRPFFFCSYLCSSSAKSQGYFWSIVGFDGFFWKATLEREIAAQILRMKLVKSPLFPCCTANCCLLQMSTDRLPSTYLPAFQTWEIISICVVYRYFTALQLQTPSVLLSLYFQNVKKPSARQRTQSGLRNQGGTTEAGITPGVAVDTLVTSSGG